MSKTFKNIIVSLTALLSFSSYAQNEKSLLWEISGNGLEKPSYVFGTIHLICEEDYVMSDVIENKLKNVDSYYAEIDFSNMENLVEMQKMMVADQPLSQRISRDQYNHMKNLLKETLSIDIQDYENLSDAAISSMLTLKSFPCDKHKMYEMELLQKATLYGKKMGGLESAKDQMNFMSENFNFDAAVKMVEELKKVGFANTEEMVTLYKNQDIEGLLDFMNNASYMDEKTYDNILVKRNNNWLHIMPELMKTNSVFFAVGAAHLGGKDGVLKLLKNKGYQVKPIVF